MSAFAKRLIELRHASGLSQYELAKRAGLTRQAMSLLELGQREPNWATVQRLAKALAVSCEAFMDRRASTDEKKPKRSRPKKK
jgi:transcriptional regulator with XRE-family HTH domain